MQKEGCCICQNGNANKACYTCTAKVHPSCWLKYLTTQIKVIIIRHIEANYIGEYIPEQVKCPVCRSYTSIFLPERRITRSMTENDREELFYNVSYVLLDSINKSDNLEFKKKAIKELYKFILDNKIIAKNVHTLQSNLKQLYDQGWGDASYYHLRLFGTTIVGNTNEYQK